MIHVDGIEDDEAAQSGPTSLHRIGGRFSPSHTPAACNESQDYRSNGSSALARLRPEQRGDPTRLVNAVALFHWHGDRVPVVVAVKSRCDVEVKVRYLLSRRMVVLADRGAVGISRDLNGLRDVAEPTHQRAAQLLGQLVQGLEVLDGDDENTALVAQRLQSGRKHRYGVVNERQRRTVAPRLFADPAVTHAPSLAPSLKLNERNCPSERCRSLADQRQQGHTERLGATRSSTLKRSHFILEQPRVLPPIFFTC